MVSWFELWSLVMTQARVDAVRSGISPFHLSALISPAHLSQSTDVCSCGGDDICLRTAATLSGRRE